MKQLRYGDRVYLVGDSTADMVMGFAAALGRANSAEHLSLLALDVNGDAEQIDLLIGPATMMTAEPANDEFPEPENTAAHDTIRARTKDLDAASS